MMNATLTASTPRVQRKQSFLDIMRQNERAAKQNGWRAQLDRGMEKINRGTTGMPYSDLYAKTPVTQVRKTNPTTPTSTFANHQYKSAQQPAKREPIQTASKPRLEHRTYFSLDALVGSALGRLGTQTAKEASLYRTTKSKIGIPDYYLKVTSMDNKTILLGLSGRVAEYLRENNNSQFMIENTYLDTDRNRSVSDKHDPKVNGLEFFFYEAQHTDENKPIGGQRHVGFWTRSDPNSASRRSPLQLNFYHSDGLFKLNTQLEEIAVNHYDRKGWQIETQQPKRNDRPSSSHGDGAPKPVPRKPAPTNGGSQAQAQAESFTSGSATTVGNQTVDRKSSQASTQSKSCAASAPMSYETDVILVKTPVQQTIQPSKLVSYDSIENAVKGTISRIQGSPQLSAFEVYKAFTPRDGIVDSTRFVYVEFQNTNCRAPSSRVFEFVLDAQDKYTLAHGSMLNNQNEFNTVAPNKKGTNNVSFSYRGELSKPVLLVKTGGNKTVTSPTPEAAHKTQGIQKKYASVENVVVDKFESQWEKFSVYDKWCLSPFQYVYVETKNYDKTVPVLLEVRKDTRTAEYTVVRQSGLVSNPSFETRIKASDALGKYFSIWFDDGKIVLNPKAIEQKTNDNYKYAQKPDSNNK